MFDLVHLAMTRAARSFGGDDGVFNAAGFSNQLCKLAGLSGPISGELVEVILCGRADVRQIHDLCHYKTLEPIHPWHN